MRIAVCIKQVPAVSALAFDPATKTIQREGVRSEISAFDVRALLRAIALRDDHGWTEDMITGRYVKLFSMGMAVVALEWVASVALAWRRRRARTTG